MSHGSPTRSTGRTALSASAGAVLTLVAFVAVFAAFVLAPFLLLAAALLLYVAFRPREADHAIAVAEGRDPAGPGGATGAARHHFGSGAR